MKKIIRLIVIMGVLGLSALGLTGCGSSSEPETLAVVIHKGSNFGDISDNCQVIYDELSVAATTQGGSGRVVFIRCDGDPQAYADYSIPEQDTGLSKSRLDEEVSERTSTLQTEISGAAAVAEEVDTLQALNLAANSIAAASGNKVILMVDSGTPTTGYLDYTQSGLTIADPEVIVQALQAVDAIPDFTGITVKWAYMGQTAAPQEKLSESQIKNIRETWEAIIEAGGGELVMVDGNNATTAPENAPDVSLIEPESRTIQVSAETSEDSEAEYVVMETKVLDDTMVSFLGDQAVFVDEAAATESVYATAVELLCNPDNQVYIVGTTAGGMSDFSMELSQDRAEAVKALLVSYGIDESRMTCLGLGPNNPWHLDDLDENGQMIEEIAVKNRCVYIIDTQSEDAEFLT